MPIGNQYTSPVNYFAQQYQPRGTGAVLGGMDQSMGAGVNQGNALPNLDPGKMSATGYLAQQGAMQPYGQPQAPGAPRTQTPEQFYGADQGPGAREDMAFSSAGENLKGRAAGKRTSADIENEGNVLMHQREQLQAMASRSLQARGFAPASSLGLQYQSEVDRNVAELMTRRQAQQEEQAQGQYLTWLAQAESRRRNRAEEQQRSTEFAQRRQQQLEDERRGKKSKASSTIGKAAGGALGGFLGSAFGPAGTAAGAGIGGELGGSFLDWLAG